MSQRVFRIVNPLSWHVFHGDDLGKGNLRMAGPFNTADCQDFYLQYWEDGYQIVNSKTGYYVHVRR